MTPGEKIPRYLRQFALLLYWVFFTPAICAAADLRVSLVLSGDGVPYQSFVKTFKQNLPENIRISVVERAEDFTGKEQASDLIVAVGMKAADWVTGKTASPVLATMVPSNKYAELLTKRPRAGQISAIYLDQPLSRQVDMLQAVLPKRYRKIGILYFADTRLDVRALLNGMAQHGYTLIAKPLLTRDNLFVDLEEVLKDSDVLFAVPDNAVYSSNNIRNILLSSYRRGIPLVGFSQGYVNAGALCAIFSTPENLAEQARAMAILFAQTHQLPAAQFPALYTVDVNPEVARALGIPMKSPELLRSLIEEAQKERHDE